MKSYSITELGFALVIYYVVSVFVWTVSYCW